MSARIGWALAAVTLVLGVGDVIITATYRPLLSQDAVAEHGFPFTQLSVVGTAFLGALLLTKYPRHAVGLLLVAIGVLSSISLLGEAYHFWVFEHDGPGAPGPAAVAGWLSSLLSGQLAFAGLALLFLLAPDGHFLSRRWRWAGVAIASGLLLCTLALASSDPTTFRLRDTDIGGVRGPVFTLGFALIGVGLLAALSSMAIRWRRSIGEARQQLRLVALAVAALVVGLANTLVVQSLNGGRQTWVASLPLLIAYLLIPMLITLAALRYRLYDLEVVVNRTVVLLVGLAFAAVGYVTVVVLAGRLVDTRTGDLWLSVLATAAVALAFQPLHRAVTRAAGRIAYGSRAAPYEALSDFSRRLGDTPTSDELLPAVAEAAGRAVAARRAVATLIGEGGTEVASAAWGGDRSDPAAVAHVVRVRGDKTVLGTIEVDVLRTRPLRPSDERLLEALADQASVAFRNAALEARLAEQVAELDQTTRALVESRARILEADVLVRRQLEEAISHDVLPRLQALPAQLRVARTAITEAEGSGLDTLVERTNESLEALRELTRGVFPTQLARVGLEPALRTLVARTDPAPTLAVSEVAHSRRFSARVETAAYFSCVEAVRLGADAVTISMRDDELVVELRGSTDPAEVGRAVLDRVEASDGTLILEGDRLVLRLPVVDGAPA